MVYDSNMAIQDTLEHLGGYCLNCGKSFPPQRRGGGIKKYCSGKCAKTVRNRANKDRVFRQIKELKHNVFARLANNGPIQCAICECPHETALTIGHFNGDGKEHRIEVGGSSTRMYKWILKTPLEEVLVRIRIECLYCNMYHAYTGQYPPVDERPRWSNEE